MYFFTVSLSPFTPPTQTHTNENTHTHTYIDPSVCEKEEKKKNLKILGF